MNKPVRRLYPKTRGVGTPNLAGVSVSHETFGSRIEATILLENLTVALTDNAGVIAYLGAKIYDAPEGAILFLGASADLTIQKSSAGVNADWDGDFALGTATASNNNTLTSTEADLIPSTSTPQAVASRTTAKGVSTSTEACKVFNGTATPMDVYLNVLVDDADHNVGATACNLIFNGTIKLHYINLGDI